MAKEIHIHIGKTKVANQGTKKMVVNYWLVGSTKSMEFDAPAGASVDECIKLAKRAIPGGATFASVMRK